MLVTGGVSVVGRAGIAVAYKDFCVASRRIAVGLVSGAPRLKESRPSDIDP